MKPSKITPALLDFWATHGFNVIFEGRRGVGKTALVRECFTRLGLKWKYFSSATMDPWCDFVGIPRPVRRPGSDIEVLEYVRPPDFADDQVQALFFDEFNRSHKKVRDAVMELIQFRSINGRRFENLKIVWAAINPKEEDGEEYDVDVLDPAILDRFHVHVHVPYKPDRGFFETVFGSRGMSAVNWWYEQPESIQKLVPPRRLEYALRMFELHGNVEYVLDPSVQSRSLVRALRSGSITELARRFLVSKDAKGATEWLKDGDIADAMVQLVKTESSLRPFYLPILPIEKVTKLMSEDRSVLNWVISNEPQVRKLGKVLNTIVDAQQNRKLIDYIIKNRTLTPQLARTQLVRLCGLLKTERNSQKRLLILDNIHHTLILMMAGVKTPAKSVIRALYGALEDYCNRTHVNNLKYVPWAIKQKKLGIRPPLWYVRDIHKIIPITNGLKRILRKKGVYSP